MWIHGGPYDAGQVLHDEFGGLVPEEIIDRLAEELFDESPEWVEKIRLIDDDDFLFDFGLVPTRYFDEYQQAMDSHRTLLCMVVPQQTEDRFYGMILVNLIAMMEAYLSDAFIGEVLRSEGFMRKFVASTPEFQSRQISLAQIYDSFDNICSIAEQYLGGVVWHRLDVVKNMYNDTLGVSFSDDLGAIFRGIQVRHALVHRNGKIEGEEVSITQRNVKELAEKIEEFIKYIEEQIRDLADQETTC